MASDILIQPTSSTQFGVRFRVDGQLRTVHELNAEESGAVINSIKAISGMDIAERRRPQDGAFVAQTPQGNISFRIATAGVLHGEKISIRVLDQSAATYSLRDIGLTKKYYDAATVLLLAITLFLVAHLVTKRTMPRIEKLALPHPAESVGSIFLGFCCGVLATSFLLAVLWFTPLSRTPLVERLSGGQQLERAALRPVRVVCKGVGYLSFQSDPWAARNILQRLVTRRHPTRNTSIRER